MEPEVSETPFLLTEFLVSLEEVGLRPTLRDHRRLRQVLAGEGRWTRSKLRTVLAALLAKSREEQALVTARFDSFFDFSPGQEEETFPRIDVEQALGELTSLSPVSPEKLDEGSQEEIVSRLDPPTKHLRWLALLVAALLTAVALGLPTRALKQWCPFSTVKPEVINSPPPQPHQPLPSVPREARRRYEGAPEIGELTPLPPERHPVWSGLLTAAMVLLGLGLGYGTYLWHSHRMQKPEHLLYDPYDPVRFDPGALGCKPKPWLEDETLDLAAESLAYLETEAIGWLLDQEATVEVTSSRAGLPSLVYQYRRELQTALILEDLHASSRAWNPTAGELAEGLARRGVPVIHGRFAGSPEVFSGRDDEVIRLLDLEDDNRHLLVLLFTDSKGLDREGFRVLEELADWPTAAWLDLREPRFWEEGGRRPVRHGIPVFPATDRGVRQVFAYFLSHVRGGEGSNTHGSGFRRLPPRLPVHRDLRAQVEEIAGDTLAWAQACSMVQPISVGLADALRQQFFPLLPPERIGRLFSLPGTRHTVAGLRFSAAVLTVLRSGFKVFRSNAEQEDVLRFLLAQIDAARPENRNGLASLAWEALRERVHLELEPDSALEQLARLAATPLGPAIRSELRDVVLPGEGAISSEGGRPRIPLRCVPESFEGRQHLARLAPASGIPVRNFRPLLRWEGMIAGLLILSFLITGTLGFTRYMEALKPKPLLEIGSNQQETWIRIMDGKGRWGKERMLITPGVFENYTEDLSGGFSVAAFRNGGFVLHRLKLPQGNSGRARLVLNGTNALLQCTTRNDTFGLVVERCPPGALSSGTPFSRPGWRRALGAPPPGDRLLSVGLEIEGSPAHEKELRPLRRVLLETGSVDLIYRIDLTGKNARAGAEEIVRQLAPWTDRAQLVWWWGGDNTRDTVAIQTADTLRRHFAKALRLDRGTDLDWIYRIQNFLTSKPAGRISGAQIQKLLDGREEGQGSGADILLLRVPLSPPPIQNPTEVVNIYFAFQGTSLSGIAMAQLDEVGLQLKAQPDLAAQITRHSDPEEKAREEQRLSEARAKAIQSYLATRHGIRLSRLTIEGRDPILSQNIKGSPSYERRLAKVLISMHTVNDTTGVTPPEPPSAIDSPPPSPPSTEGVLVRILLTGLVALVPHDETNHMTALLVDARKSPGGAAECFSPYQPRLRVLTSSLAECVAAGCRLIVETCSCNLSHQEVVLMPDIETYGRQLHKQPQRSIPFDQSDATDFSYIANVAQPPINMIINPEVFSPMPPSSLAVRMNLPFESVSACSLVTDEDDGVIAMGFRQIGAHEQGGEVSQALAQSAIVKFMAPKNEPVTITIRDFDGSNAYILRLRAGADGYYIELSNNRELPLSVDDPCADGIGRDFAFFFDLAQNPPAWKDRLIPYATQRKSAREVNSPECAQLILGVKQRPICPMASFNP